MSIQAFKNIGHLRLLVQKPSLFWKKIQRKYQRLTSGFFIDKPTARFIKHNRSVWKGWANPHSSKIILVDWQYNLPVWTIPGLFFANVLAKKKGARICSFSNEEWPLGRATHAVYHSLNAREHVATKNLNLDQKNQRDKIYEQIVPTLNTKEDVFGLHVRGYHLGMDIYETYLKEFSKPTVVIDEPLLATVRWAIGLMIFWEDYFSSHDVAGVVVSHDCYVDYNIVCRVAYKHKVPVYVPVPIFVSLLKEQHDARGYFYSFRAWFDALTVNEKKEAKELAKQQLAKRFRGEVTADMCSIGEKVNSAFQSDGNDHPRVLKPSDKIKVLICSHCFYDNPHAYGGMLFIDFYEWLKFLVKVAEKTDYDWYLKTHSHPLAGTLDVIKEILGSSSRIKIIPSTTKHHQLIKEGINFVLTVYGTVAHEYPALGVQVINAGYNPHVAYDFSHTPRNLQEYEEWLLNLKDVKKDINLDELYEFYYMYYYYSLIDDLIFHSFRDHLFNTPSQQHISSNIYSFYLDGWDQARHQKTIRLFEEYIDSGKRYLFHKGPVDLEESRPQEAVYLS